MAAAVQAPAKPKKSGANPTGATADTDDLDADIADDAIAEPARKKETFAERRARLAAEKAEKESGATPDASAENEATEAASAPAAEPAAVEPAKDEEPEVRTTADLYARRPRKKKVAAESEDVSTEVAAPADPATEGGEQ